MTAVLDRIESVREKLNSAKNFDQIQEIVSSLPDEEQHAFGIFIEAIKKLKSFIAERNDVDDDLMIWLEILGIYLMMPDDERKKESKEQMKKIKEKHEYAIESYRRTQKVPLLQKALDGNSELLRKMLAKLYILEDIKKRRIRDSTEIKIYLKMVVKILSEKGWSKTQQRNFIYDLYYCFNYENCRNIDPKSYKNRIWVMIHRL